MRSALLLSAVLLSALSIAQESRPALITRKQFAESNLLFATYGTLGNDFQFTRGCIRISPDGHFQREIGKGGPPKHGEVGTISNEDLARLKAMLADAEFRSYRQDPTKAPKSVRIEVGYEIFEVSIYRGADHQDLVFFNSSSATAEPPKVQALQKMIFGYLTPKDSTLQSVKSDGCRAHVKPAENTH